MSRGQRSAACRATASVPADERNSGTDASDAASTAQAPAAGSSTPGRRRSSQGARRQGAEPRVSRAARARAPHEPARASTSSDYRRAGRLGAKTSSCQDRAPGLTSPVARTAEGPRTRHGGGPEAAPVEPEWVRQPLAAALSLEPAETLAAFVAAIWIVAPVCGFRPVRADR